MEDDVLCRGHILSGFCTIVEMMPGHPRKIYS